MTKSVKLQDGTELTIRDLTKQDVEALMEFFSALSAEDRRYLRIDVTNRKTVEQRLNLMDFGYHFRIGAFQGDKLVAEGALELPFEEWRRNQGEVRVLISGPFQHRGVGMLLLKELYCLSLRQNVETVVIWMMKPQIAAQNLARKMGFRDVSILPDYVRDQDGQMQDLIIMKSGVRALMKEIEKFYGEVDWHASP
jgi:L-amino acid N-acyltransferase YncA